jgi:MraZ protein
MFHGNFHHTIDDKGRISVPARFRDLLNADADDRLVITNAVSKVGRCLDVYPYSAWIELLTKVRAKPQFDQRVARFRRYYISRAHDCVLDKQGRILLPPILREYAGLKREVVFASDIHKFCIWDRDQWERVFGQDERDFSEHPEEFDALEI